MVLNMADFVKSWKSLQTLWNAFKAVLKWFVTASATFCVDLGGIRTAWKLADFEQRPGPIVLNMANFVKSWKSLQTLWNAPKTVLKGFVTACKSVAFDLVWIGKRRKLTDFKHRPMVFNMADFDKSWKSLQTLWTPFKTVLKWFMTPCKTVSVDLVWIFKSRKLADFGENAWAKAHGFEHGPFW